MQANLICDRCKLRVLIVDNDERDRDDFAEMIDNWGGEPILAVGAGKDLVKDAIEKKDKFRCRVALVDMRLLDDSDSRDREGLELVKALKPAKSIVVTGFAHYGAARDAMGREYGASGFVGKEENPEQLLNALINARTEACACPGNDQIKWPRGLSAIKVMERLLPDIEDADDQANQLVARLLPNRPVRLKPFSGAVRSISPTPYRRSIVLRAEIDRAEPLVVKFADKARIEREVEAFEKFIDGNLMDKRYARVKESETDFDLGALIYDFLGSSLDRMDLFSEYYAKANLPNIQNVITQIFTAWKSHYQVSKYIKESLYDLYDWAWNNKWRARLEEFQDRRQLYPPAALAVYKLPHAVQWTLNYAVTSAPTNNRVAITHGDMHGDNIYVDRDNKVWQSDFERSGLGPIHRDFVQLELDLLTRLLPYAQGDAQSYFELIVALLCEEPQLNSSLRKNAPFSKTFDTILFLRQQAESVVGFTRERDAYSWGLLFTALFRATSIANQMNQFNVELAALMLCRERERGIRLCLLLDEFDELCRALPPPALANLRALRDANKYQLCYGVFVRDHPARLRPPGEYEGFYELFSRSVLWLGPYDDADALDMLRLLEARRNRALTPDQRSRIVALSGGHPGLITALFDAFSADPELFSSSEAVLLSGVVEEEARKLWDSFASDEKLALSHVAQGVELDKTIQQSLLNKGVLRRCDGALRIFSPVFAEFVHRNGAPTDDPLWIDEKARVVWVGGARHDDLTASEFDLLAFLYATPGELCTHEEIHRHLYAEDKVIVGNALEALVKRLRQKIEPERRRPRYLLTVHKKGYRLVIHPVLEAHQQSAQARFTASTSEPSATMSRTARR